MRVNKHMFKLINITSKITYTDCMLAYSDLSRYISDPVAFITECVKIQHPTRGMIPFELYDYQKDLIHSYQNNDNNITLSSRMMGISSTHAAFVLWFSLFHSDQSIAVLTPKNHHSMNLLELIYGMYAMLPSNIRELLPITYHNKHNLAFGNRSQIMCGAATECVLRGMSINLLVLDDYGVVHPQIQDVLYACAVPTLYGNSSKLIMSNTGGAHIKTLFHKLYTEALSGKNRFTAKHIPWHELRGVDFEKDMKTMLSAQQWKTEYECEFYYTFD